MSTLQPFSFCNTFYPLGHTSVTSFAEYLPVGEDAKCLLLECDPRKVLFTVFSEYNSAIPRKYELTCCDSDPIIFARNVFLFTALIDGNDACSKLWNILHDFYIDADAMDIIRSHSAKLVHLSSTMESWNDGPYGKTLQMLNEDTLETLHHFCMKYANAPSSNDFKADCQKIAYDYSPQKYREYELILPLCRSFGLTAIMSSDIANHHMFQFWTNGVADPEDVPKEPIWNPLFSRSEKFGVDHRASPLSIYHFLTVSQDFEGSTRETVAIAKPGFHISQDFEECTRKTVASAKAQFKAWCDAFRDSIPRIVMKSVVADPLAVCFAFSGNQNPSSPWAELQLEPSSFNAIDTSCLVDRVGGINVLVATIPLLQVSPSASIHTESTNQSWADETKLLRRLLCGDVAVMCNILGIAPIAYLTMATTCGIVQDLPTIHGFSSQDSAPGIYRIVWKIPALGDSAITKPLKVSVESEDFIKLLCAIYDEMFTAQNNLVYTNTSFAALLAFIKSRISVDWDMGIKGLIDALIGHPDRDYSPDLQLQFHRFGVLNLFPNVSSPEVSCIVFTVPRRYIQTIFEKSLNEMSIFELQLHDATSYDLCSYIPVFGHRSGSEIEKDRDGWYGSSDLHLRLYIATAALSDKKTTISFDMSNRTIACDQDHKVEIFRSDLFDPMHVQIFSVPSLAHFVDIPVLESEDVVARLGVKDLRATFTTRITVNTLTTETKVTATQTSPCVMTLQCGSDHICQFPYPIEGKSSTIRVARKSGWVEVCVSLSMPHDGRKFKHLEGGYSTAFLPLTRDIGTNMCSWNLPLINFPQLSRIDDAFTIKSLYLHIMHVFSDLEKDQENSGHQCPFVSFKRTVASIFQTICNRKGRAFGIQHKDVMQVLFFVAGFYMDSSSHNIVAEAYVFKLTDENRDSVFDKKEKEKVQILTLEIDSEELGLWESSLPAMIERCRDWEHKETCEYSEGNYKNFCSCGIGKSTSEFLKVKEWTEFAPDVVRFALSPIFPAPFVEQIRHQALKQREQVDKELRTSIVGTKACAACCRTGDTKKCGNCEKVYYCGSICQKRHWKLHKKECRKD